MLSCVSKPEAKPREPRAPSSIAWSRPACPRRAQAGTFLKWGWIPALMAPLLFSHGAAPPTRAANMASARFMVEGDLDINYNSIGNRKLSNHTTFRVLVDDSKVVIRTIGFGTKAIEFWEFATDGTHTHLLEKRKDDTVITNSADSQTWGFVPPRTQLVNRAALTLATTPTPTMVGAITPVWLAYGSQHYFQSRTSGEELDSNSIFLLVLPDDTNIRDVAFWKWAKANPAFLERLDCQHLDLSVNRNASQTDTVTNAVFSVTHWTNTGFATFPMRFELRLFLDSENGRAPARPAIATIVVGSAKRIVPLTHRLPALFPAQLPVPTWVIDERVQRAGPKGGPLTYFSKDGKIMPLDEAKDSVTRAPGSKVAPKQ